jgi:hypothetical protein
MQYALLLCVLMLGTRPTAQHLIPSCIICWQQRVIASFLLNALQVPAKGYKQGSTSSLQGGATLAGYALVQEQAQHLNQAAGEQSVCAHCPNHAPRPKLAEWVM